MIFFATVLGVAAFCAPAPAAGPASYFLPGANRIVLDSDLCTPMQRHRVNDSAAIAVYVLAHEEGHAHDADVLARTDCNRRGAYEGFADCWGVGHYTLVARAVGYRQRDALRLRRRARAFLAGGVSSYGPIPASCWNTPEGG